MSAKESTPKPISRDDITRTVSAAAEKKALLDKNRRLEEESRRQRECLEELVDEQTAELRDSEQQLKVLFEKAPDPYFLNDLKGTFIDVNEAAVRLTGYAREELVGKSFLKLKLLSPRQIAKASTLLARNALGKDTGPDEFILSRKDGKQVPVEIRTHPVKIQGKWVVLGLARDITERKRVEESLARSQELVNQAGQMAKVGGWEVDAKTLEVTWTEETYRIHELPLDQHPPLDKALDFFDPEDRTKLRHAIESALSHGEPYDLELRFTTAKGKKLWTHSICTPKVVDGKTVKLVGIFQDITERKQMETILGERVKELSCLCGISELVAKPGISLEEIFQRTVDLIPTAWQYPEIACARITVDGKQFETENFEETIWKQASDILLHGERSGTIELCYLEEKEERDEGPFLKEERNLLNTVTEQLGHIMERAQSEARIEHLTLVLRAIRNVKQLITREKDRDKLLKGACDNLTETRGYANAWITLLDESGKLVTHAESGVGKDFLPVVERLKRGELSTCMQRALKQSESVVTEDPVSTCIDCPLSANYAGRSAATVQLEHEGKVYGLLSVSVSRETATDVEELGLFREVATDIAFALRNMELEEQRTQAEERTQHLTRVLQAIRNVNQIVIREKDRDQLLSLVCSALIETRGYHNVWIVLLDERKQLVTVAEAGLEDKFVPILKQLKENDLTRCARIALSQSEVVVTEDPSSTCSDCPLARSCEGRSSLTVRLNHLGKVYGLLTVSTPKMHATDEEEHDLLKEVSEDIGFALHDIGLEEKGKRGAEALRAAAQQWRITFDAISDIVCLVDVEGRILRCNEAMINFLGKPFSDILGCSYNQLIHSSSEPIESSLLIRRRETGRRETMVSSVGDRWFNTSVDPLLDENHNLISTVHIMSDITDRKQAEEQIVAYQQQLRLLASQLSLGEESARRRIAAALHDQVGESLFIINMKLGALREHLIQSDHVGHLDEIRELIGKLSGTTRSLTFDLAAPVLYELGLEAALEWLAENIHDKYDILIEFEHDDQPKPLDEDVQVCLFRAVHELLVNVAKHAQTRSAKVSMCREGNEVHIVAEDDGVGFNLSELLTPRGRIRGFGLFNIRERLESFGGHAELESEEGHGTRVTLVQPLKPQGETSEGLM